MQKTNKVGKERCRVVSRAETATAAGGGLLWMLLWCWLFSYLTGCTTGGGKICFGYEEINEIKNTSGYAIPKGGK